MQTPYTMRPHYKTYRAEIQPFYRPLTELEKVDFIISICARQCGVMPELVKEKGKKCAVMNAKHYARYFIHNFTSLTLELNADKTGAKDHSSTIWSFKKVSDLCDTDRDFRATFYAIEDRVSSVLTRVEPEARRLTLTLN